jgi:predicted membrane protein
MIFDVYSMSDRSALRRALNVLTFYVLILHFYFNFKLNNFSNSIRQLTVRKKLKYICFTFTDVL